MDDKRAREILEDYIYNITHVGPVNDAIRYMLYQEPKTGHWLEEFNDIEGEVRFTCSSCGKYQLFKTDYCPNCGCRMEEGANE